MAKLDFNKGEFAGELNAIQPVTDDYSTDGQQPEFAKIDHQHALSPTLRNAIYGTGGTAASAGSKFGRRNLLDNGKMEIAQRTGTALTSGVFASYGGCYADRWNFYPILGTSIVYASYPIPVDEFTTCTIVDGGSVAKAALAVGDFSILRQNIEGFNLQHLKWGTTNALPLAFSFWAQCSVAQTIIIELDISGTTISRSVNITNVWTKYQVTFPGYTGAIPVNTNAIALAVTIWLAGGTNYTGGAALGTTWGTNGNTRAFGCGNFYATASRQFFITGCQLEVGTIASPFEHLKYSDELQNCQRYLLIPCLTSDYPRFRTHYYNSNYAEFAIPTPTSMRATPSIMGVGTTDYRMVAASGGGGLATPASNFGPVLSQNTITWGLSHTSGVIDATLAFVTKAAGFNAEI